MQGGLLDYGKPRVLENVPIPISKHLEMNTIKV